MTFDELAAAEIERLNGEVARLRDELALCCDLKREYQEQAASERERMRRALHEIAEEWAGAECGEPVHAQEAYAIGLAAAPTAQQGASHEQP